MANIFSATPNAWLWQHYSFSQFPVEGMLSKQMGMGLGGTSPISTFFFRYLQYVSILFSSPAETEFRDAVCLREALRSCPWQGRRGCRAGILGKPGHRAPREPGPAYRTTTRSARRATRADRTAAC